MSCQMSICSVTILTKVSVMNVLFIKWPMLAKFIIRKLMFIIHFCQWALLRPSPFCSLPADLLYPTNVTLDLTLSSHVFSGKVKISFEISI